MDVPSVPVDLTHLYPIPMAVGMMLFSVCGVITNFIVMIAIVINKNVHTRCYGVIFAHTLADFVSSMYYVQLRIIIFNYGYNWPSSKCYFTSLYGLIAINIQTGLTVMLGVDRLLCIKFPLKYSSFPLSGYYAFMFTPPVVYSLTICYLGYVYRTDTPVAVCFVPNAYADFPRFVYTYSNGAAVILVFLIYITAWIILRNKTLTGHGKHILNTLIIVMAIYALTWTFTISMMNIISFLIGRNKLGKTIEMNLAWVVVINSSSNFVVYYWRNVEMRHGIHRVLTGHWRHRKYSPRLTTVTAATCSTAHGCKPGFNSLFHNSVGGTVINNDF